MGKTERQKSASLEKEKVVVKGAVRTVTRREQKRLRYEVFGTDSSEDDSRDSSGDSSSGDSGSGDSGGDSSSDS